MKLTKIALAALIAGVAPISVAVAQGAADPLSFEMNLPASDATPVLGKLTPRFGVVPLRGVDGRTVDRLAAVGGTVPMWTGSATTAGVNYSYKMVGTDPSIAQANPVTTVPSVVVPVAFNFVTYGVTLDPTKPDAEPTAEYRDGKGQ